MAYNIGEANFARICKGNRMECTPPPPRGDVLLSEAHLTPNQCHPNCRA